MADSSLHRSSSAPPWGREELNGSVGRRFLRTALNLAGQPALVAEQRTYSYAEVLAEVRNVARLVRLVPQPQAGCVAHLVDVSAEMVFAHLGVLCSGRPVLGIHPGVPIRAQRSVFEDARPELILTSARHEHRARELVSGTGCRVVRLDEPGPAAGGDDGFPEVSAGEPATLLYTSGSTGQPKGVVRSHRAVLHRVWLSAELDGVRPGDRQSLLTHSCFASAELDLVGPLLLGATVCLKDLAACDLGQFGAWVRETEITVLHPPALLFRRWMQSMPRDAVVPSVRLVAVAGDVVLPADLRLWKQQFPSEGVLMHRFSSTEAGLIAVEKVGMRDSIPDDIVPVGFPVQDKSVSIVDERGDPVPPGNPGEIVVESRFLATGYWRRPEQTAEVFQQVEGDTDLRRFRTGDLGHLLPDGRLLCEGRKDHQVKIRGFRVELRELEQALVRIPGIREAVVVARREDGESRLTAFIVVTPGHPSSVVGIRTALAGQLPDWKVPAAIRIVEALPLTPTGKVDRAALSAQVSEEPCEATDGVPRTPLERELASMWAKALGRATVGIRDDFFGLGGHSLQAMQLVLLLGQFLGRRVPIAELVARPTVAAFAAALEPGGVPVRPGPMAMRGSGDGVPWVHVPGIYGVEFLPASLARVIGEFRPYLDSLEFPGADGNGALLEDVASLAAEMVRQISVQCPEGPILVSGYSMGGIVAYETARLLLERGREVEAVVLLDTVLPLGMRRRTLWEQMGVLRGRMGGRPWGGRVAYLSDLLVWRLSLWGRHLARRIPGRGQDLRNRLRAAARNAKRGFRPLPVSCPVILLRAMKPHPRDTGLWETAPENGWGEVGNTRFQTLPVECDHERLFLEPVSPAACSAVAALAEGHRVAVPAKAEGP